MGDRHLLASPLKDGAVYLLRGDICFLFQCCLSAANYNKEARAFLTIFPPNNLVLLMLGKLEFTNYI